MRTVYVLGAGASQFAAFPLAKGLWSFLQEKENHRRCEINLISERQTALDFIKKVKSTLQSEPDLGKRWLLDNGQPNLEFAFSVIDAAGQNNACRQTSPATLLEDIRHTILTLHLSRSDLGSIEKGLRSIVSFAFAHHSLSLYHLIRSNPLVRSVACRWQNRIRPDDILISFNWDILCEMLLWKAGKWFPNDGYGIEIQTNTSGPARRSPTCILKLHGSCNWALSHRQDQQLEIDDAGTFFPGCDVATPDPPWRTSDYGDSIIIPSYLKDPFHVAVLPLIWKKAKQVLSDTEKIIVLGYSLPEADAFAQELFRDAISRNCSLRHPIVLVLHRDDQAYQRWKELCATCGKDCVRIQEPFEEFIRTPKSN